MQVSVKNTDDVLASLLTDHSPITFSCFKNEESNRGRANLITAWLKMNLKKNCFRYFKWTFQWKHSKWLGKMGIFEIQY